MATVTTIPADITNLKKEIDSIKSDVAKKLESSGGTITGDLTVVGGISGELSGNASTATKLKTAKTINGVSFDGSKNIELTAEDLNLEQTVELASGALQKNQNGADIQNKDKFIQTIGAAKAASGSINIGGDSNNWTTAQFIDWLESQGAFNHPYWMCKGSWSYASNKIITDTGCGNIQLAGSVVEVMGTRSAMTIRVTTPTTATNGATTKAQFTYINHGDGYSPGWRRDWNRGGDTMSGELITTSQNALRMISGNYGVILRQDGGSLYLLVTASGDQYGDWSSLRPFYFNLSTGVVTMGHGLNVNGQVAPTNYSNFDSRYQTKNTASKAANGWHKDVSTGIITQWGYISNAGAGLTFPIAFPSACVNITITNAHGRFDYSIAVNSLSNTGAKFNSEGNGNMYWTSIGY